MQAYIRAHLSPSAVTIPAASVSQFYPNVVAVMDGDESDSDGQDCWQCGARGWVEDPDVEARWWCRGCAAEDESEED